LPKNFINLQGQQRKKQGQNSACRKNLATMQQYNLSKRIEAKGTLMRTSINRMIRLFSLLIIIAGTCYPMGNALKNIKSKIVTTDTRQTIHIKNSVSFADLYVGTYVTDGRYKGKVIRASDTKIIPQDGGCETFEIVKKKRTEYTFIIASSKPLTSAQIMSGAFKNAAGEFESLLTITSLIKQGSGSKDLFYEITLINGKLKITNKKALPSCPVQGTQTVSGDIGEYDLSKLYD
jgi:hypothetical protein